MALPELGIVTVTVCSVVVAVVLIYDAKRALWPRLPGEQPWRRGRVVGTTTAIIALSVLQRTMGPLWLRRMALLTLLLALGAVLSCSVPLKRIVAAALTESQGTD